MTEKTQHLTRSQFVLTYGPGSIIETEEGPRLIPSIRNGISEVILNSGNIADFEIPESRLGTVLRIISNNRSRIFSLPTNAGLHLGQSQGIYDTYIFPIWKVCYGLKHDHGDTGPILYSDFKCPLCKEKDDSSAVRFVVACTKGHLDEIPWEYAVHGSKNDCSPEYYEWRSDGSSLSDISIKCPKCKAETTMQNIYQTDFKCTNRKPESELPRNRNYGAPFLITPERNSGKCDSTMKALQRQSSALRTADTVTLLTIPDYDSPIANILQRGEVSSAVRTIFDLAGQNVAKEIFLNAVEKSSVLSSEVKDTLIKYINDQGTNKLKDLLTRLTDENRKFFDFMYEEYDSLSSGEIRSSSTFSISEPISTGENGSIPSLEVYPVHRLRTVTAQVGYHRTPVLEKERERAELLGPEPISSGSSYGGYTWYPGYEGKGEGLFITVRKGTKHREGDSWKIWEEESKITPRKNQGNPLWRDVAGQPLFVWFHTLSHSLIRALAQYAGYSPASLRERVYLDRDFENGGILIYTTSAGEDGSMGGLVGLANDKDFTEILKIADGTINFCSNDPLCFETRKPSNRENGAACYSCLFTSETSCEHRNMFLDRHIITGD